MAGIGFVLRKLARQDNLSGLVQAYVHSALASTGPWLFTVIALGSIMAIGSNVVEREALFDFRIIIIYNFAFSLVFSAPVFMVATRYLADCIHRQDVSSAPGMMIAALALLFVTQMPLVLWFYLVFADLPLLMAMAAIGNYLVISGIWLVVVFVSALKDYKTITRTFAIGVTVSVFASGMLAYTYEAVGMLIGFSFGLGIIMASLMARVFAEYPYRMREGFAFLPYFKKYWELALGGLIYNMAVWVDKWIMWFAPEAERMSNNLLLYPNYDSAMFLAYLTIVPAMAMFVFSIETNFFEHYVKFYRDIQNKVPYRKIQKNHRAIIQSITSSGRSFLILQGSIAVMVVLMAPRIFDMLGINYLQIGMFRYGVLGAFFHVMTMFLMILLSYFDNRKAAFAVQFVFLATNASFTWFFMVMGFEYYGYGYFLASVVTFVLTAVITLRYTVMLPYHTFVTANTSVS